MEWSLFQSRHGPGKAGGMVGKVMVTCLLSSFVDHPTYWADEAGVEWVFCWVLSGLHTEARGVALFAAFVDVFLLFCLHRVLVGFFQKGSIRNLSMREESDGPLGTEVAVFSVPVLPVGGTTGKLGRTTPTQEEEPRGTGRWSC